MRKVVSAILVIALVLSSFVAVTGSVTAAECESDVGTVDPSCGSGGDDDDGGGGCSTCVVKAFDSFDGELVSFSASGAIPV